MPDEKNPESALEKPAKPAKPTPDFKASDYTADDLSSLKGLEAVRKKPGMYIGGTDERALHHCVSEVLDNSVDEFLAGHCNHIDVTIHSDGSISIRDNSSSPASTRAANTAKETTNIPAAPTALEPSA
jgi:DNA gyrase subunit B